MRIWTLNGKRVSCGMPYEVFVEREEVVCMVARDEIWEIGIFVCV